MTRSRDKVIDLVRVHLGSPSEAPEVPHAAADRESSGEAAEKPIPTRFQSARSLIETCSKSSTSSVVFVLLVPLGGAAAAPHNGTKAVLTTDLELFGPQQGQRWKRTRGNGNRPAVRPPGPEKWSHRLGHPT